jgi:hypothetical protein
MLNVQTYLKSFGLQKLQSEFNITVSDYEDRVVLNYSQIESPRFNSICDECRGLILRKNSWDILSIAFQRFYNVSEGVEQEFLKKDFSYQRIPSFINGMVSYNYFDILEAQIFQKIDGSLISLYNDSKNWCVATRKKAFAEGNTSFGTTFAELFDKAAKKTNLYSWLEKTPYCKNITWIFELTSPESRVVTPYADTKITLIGARSKTGSLKELLAKELDSIAREINVDRPQKYSCSSYNEVIELVKKFPVIEEGVVLVKENRNGFHWRLKCKNPAYLAIAHLRQNGNISPKRILALIMNGEYVEYLIHFSEDKKYFSFVENYYNKMKARILDVFERNKNIGVQKDFAIAIMRETLYPFESGIIFQMRKTGKSVDVLLNQLGALKISKGMNLKELFVKEFNINIDEES